MPKQPTRSIPFTVLLAALLMPVAAFAQTETTAAEKEAQEAGFGRIPEDAFRLPDNSVSIGVRLSGKAKVEFTGIGAITSDSLPTDDITTEIARTYNDGFVSLDSRTDANGDPIAADGKTNVWAYSADSQLADNGGGIFLTSYSTVSDGSTVKSDSGPTPGFDIEISRRIGGNHLAWGLQLGLGLSDINAKTSGEISASLRKLTDYYSLLGAAAPGAPYEAPVYQSDTVTNPDGSTTPIQTDVSVLLSSLPGERTDTIDSSAAQINGFWQVRGAFFSARMGPWIELPLSEQFTIRASGGVSGTVIGAFMRFDERFLLPDTDTELTAMDQTNSDSWGMIGGYAALEARWWLTERTGFFAGASYEAVSGDVELKSGDRLAKMNVETGAGVRVGFTTRF